MNRTPVLFLNVLIIATCGLIYELLAGTLASYVLGDTVTQFSLIIGLYLSALGAGAWLSRFIDRGIARAFIEVELGVALLGGISAPLLFLSFARLTFFHLVLYGLVFAIGTLVGLELPLLMRIIKDHLDFKELVSRVLAFDYLGALVASLLFPLVLVPHLNLVRTSLLFGMLNAAVGLWATWLLLPLMVTGPPDSGTIQENSQGEPVPRRRGEGMVLGLRVRGFLVLLVLAIAFIKADALTTWAEESLYTEPILYSRTTPYQRIVVTKAKGNGFQLFLNGHLQFNSVDEYRYHEALVHPAVVVAGGAPRRVLILGGGDGLALREVLKYPSVEAVTLVDIDPGMTGLPGNFHVKRDEQQIWPLAELNRHAYQDPRLTVVNQDAMIWLEEVGWPFDVVIIDFPDPNNFALGKLYTTRFYRLLQKHLTPASAVAIQCTSPLVARKTFWCIVRTMEAAGFNVRPYHAAVPSFGSVWGFCLAKMTPFAPPAKVPGGIELRFLNDAVLPALFALPADLGPVDVEINRLDNQVLVRYHEAEWRRWE
jgi:spermidine synthase